jgi:hypothetical protein
LKENTRVLLSLGAGLLGGALIAASGSETLLRAADAIVPIGTIWINAIRMTVIPLVVSLLVTGVAGAADLARDRPPRWPQPAHVPGTARGHGHRHHADRHPGVSLARDQYLHPALAGGSGRSRGSDCCRRNGDGLRGLAHIIDPTNPIAAAGQRGDAAAHSCSRSSWPSAVAKLAPATREPLLAFFRSLVRGDAR